LTNLKNQIDPDGRTYEEIGRICILEPIVARVPAHFIQIIHLILTIPIQDLVAQRHSTSFEICCLKI